MRISRAQSAEKSVVSSEKEEKRKQPVRADFECFEDFESAKRGEIRGIIRRRKEKAAQKGRERKYIE